MRRAELDHPAGSPSTTSGRRRRDSSGRRTHLVHHTWHDQTIGCSAKRGGPDTRFNSRGRHPGSSSGVPRPPVTSWPLRLRQLGQRVLAARALGVEGERLLVQLDRLLGVPSLENGLGQAVIDVPRVGVQLGVELEHGDCLVDLAVAEEAVPLRVDLGLAEEELALLLVAVVQHGPDIRLAGARVDEREQLLRGGLLLGHALPDLVDRAGVVAGRATGALGQVGEPVLELVVRLNLGQALAVLDLLVDPVPERSHIVDPGLGALERQLAVPVAGHQQLDAVLLGQNQIPVGEPRREVVGNPVPGPERGQAPRRLVEPGVGHRVAGQQQALLRDENRDVARGVHPTDEVHVEGGVAHAHGVAVGERLGGRDQLDAGLLGLQVQAMEGHVFLQLGCLHRARVELGQLLLRGLDCLGEPLRHPLGVGRPGGHGRTDLLVANDRAVLVDRIAAGVIAMLVGVDQHLEVGATEARAMTLRSSASTFGTPMVSTTTMPWDVANATGAVDEMWSPTQTRITFGVSLLTCRGNPATVSAAPHEAAVSPSTAVMSHTVLLTVVLLAARIARYDRWESRPASWEWLSSAFTPPLRQPGESGCSFVTSRYRSGHPCHVWPRVDA